MTSVKIDTATAAQNQAAHPTRSTWVNANAGSGKTRVLTNKVARLLLYGVNPQRILCLTYTNAAAATMQTRLFDGLGAWAMLEDEALSAELEKLGEEADSLTPETLSRARRLFAGALETPGGLKIQTIHAFCDSILRRFPMEAGVSPQFKVMEERDQRLLRAQVLDELAGSEAANTLERLAGFMTDLNPDDLLREIQKHKSDFVKTPRAKDFNISGDETPAQLITEFLSAETKEYLEMMIGMQSKGDKTTEKNLAQLARVMNAPSPEEAMSELTDLLLTKTGTPRKKLFPPEASADSDELWLRGLGEFKDQFLALIDTINRLAEYTRTCALHDFARTFLARFETSKAEGGWLDYDDLIILTERLLTKPEVAPWVLYRLDGGLEHILVDESQDTSPRQWNVIQTLHADFTAGDSASDAPRTLFVVGDEKQSIYSFQGADPHVFTEKKLQFQTNLKNADDELCEEALSFSFRTGPNILALVDRLFSNIEHPAFGEAMIHKSFHKDKPGRVDLWPFIEKAEAVEMPEWDAPLAAPITEAAHLTLAAQIAQEVKNILANPPQINIDTPEKRELQAGDILILLRRRSPLFHAIIKELKKNQLAVSGADSFKIKQELAVCDILSLLHFTLLPEDDLSLAEALRAPLFNLSEQDLFTLAHGRGDKTLWQVLQNRRDEFPAAYAILTDLLARADYLRPYEMIERILIHHGARSKMIARLGDEIEDALDELLTQALKFETSAPASLTGFLQWFQADDLTIKRALDDQSNQIRVMTIHGAKGLESPLVILPDTGEVRVPSRDKILKTADGLLLWASRSDEASATQTTIKEQKKALQKQEEMRLLYVALTRAESWLIICGAGSRGQNGDSWYDLIEGAARAGDATESTDGRLRLQSGEWTQAGATAKTTTDSEIPQLLPQEQSRTASPPPPAKKTISPSRLLTGGEKPKEQQADSPTDTLAMQAALDWGRDLHLLLEHLPKYPAEQWQEISAALLPSHTHEPAHVKAVFDRASTLLQDKALEFLFKETTYAEVGISAQAIAPTGTLQDYAMLGYIDRLVIEDKRILAVDYKSHKEVPENPEAVPAAILAQMAAYHYGLRQIYPKHKIEMAVLWTRTGALMNLPEELIYAALESAKPPASSKETLDLTAEMP